MATRSELGLARPGHTFVGWRVAGTDTVLEPGSEYTIKGYTVFEAVWEKL